MSTEFHWIAVVIVSVASIARLTRLWTLDDFPPVKWFRFKIYERLENHEDWQKITYCPYCAGFWVALAVLLAGYYSDFHAAWWIINGALGGSYVAAKVVAKDMEEDED